MREAILGSSFQPRATGFTSLLQVCARQKAWRKAIETFDTMKELGIAANTYTFSALISALGSSGQWEKALEYFREQQKSAQDDPLCSPNTVSYSAALSACERGGR